MRPGLLEAVRKTEAAAGQLAELLLLARSDLKTEDLAQGHTEAIGNGVELLDGAGV
jgi:hypothetical protein